MRLWSLHPGLLDRAALVAGWREGLLAQKVLRGLTTGYRHHPQLVRFQTLDDPVAGIATWLHGVADEADARGYRFDRQRVVMAAGDHRLAVTSGQLELEWEHLRAKVALRDPAWLPRLGETEGGVPRAHPMLDVVPGPAEAWERATPPT